MPAGGQDDAIVGRHDPVAAERREVDAVVERRAVDDPRAPARRAEWLGETTAATASGSRSGRPRAAGLGDVLAGVGPDGDERCDRGPASAIARRAAEPAASRSPGPRRGRSRRRPHRPARAGTARRSIRPPASRSRGTARCRGRPATGDANAGIGGGAGAPTMCITARTRSATRSRSDAPTLHLGTVAEMVASSSASYVRVAA